MSASDQLNERKKKRHRRRSKYQHARRALRRYFKGLAYWWWAQTLVTRLQLVFAGVVAFSTSAYALVAILQWSAMRGQLTVMQQTLEVPNAAQLVLAEIEKLQLTVGQEGFFTAKIQNVGRVPARVTQIAVYLYVRRVMPLTPVYRRRGTISQPIAPGVPASLMFHVKALNPKKFAAVCRGEITARLFGEVSYNDGFREAPPLTFCVFWKARAAPCH